MSQALNFNEQLRFHTFSIQIHVVNFDHMANLTRTYEGKHTCCTFWLLKDIIMEYEGRKSHCRDKLYVQGGGWVTRTSKSRYSWNIAKATLILKTTNQLTKQCRCGNSFNSVAATRACTGHHLVLYIFLCIMKRKMSALYCEIHGCTISAYSLNLD